MISWKGYIDSFLGYEQHHSDRFPVDVIHNKQKAILQIHENEFEASHYAKTSWISVQGHMLAACLHSPISIFLTRPHTEKLSSLWTLESGTQ